MADLQSANGAPIGALEAGAIPLHAHATVQTAFDGTTPGLTVGTTAVPDGLATAAGTAVAATGFKGNLSGTLTGIPLAQNTVIYAKATGTGITTGKATIIVTFVPKRGVEGIPFPAN